MKKLTFFFIFIIALLLGGFGLYQGVINRTFSLNDLFVGGHIKGVDLSSYQENVDFNKLKDQGIEFAFIKATEGSKHVDSSFARKWQDTKKAGVLAGAYHYFSYQSPGADQAKNFIKTVGDLSGRLLPVVDLELTPDEVINPPEVATVVRSLKAFLAVVEEEYKVKPILNSRQDYYEKYLAADFGDYPRWVTNFYFPVFLEAGDNWDIWQYTDRGVLEGYSGEEHIDLNVLNRRVTLESITIK